MRLLLIDGSSVLSTSFHGSVPNEYHRVKTDEERARVLSKVMKAPDGQYTNGVFTMMKILEKIIRTQKPTHLCIAWDKSRDTFRRKLYPEYKSNRADTKPELKSQFGLAQRVLDAMGVPQFVFDDYEADDILGTLSRQFGEHIPTYVLTKDQDAIQLVDDHTRVWLITSKAKDMYEQVGVDIKHHNIPDNVFELTPLYVEEFYGVKPLQIVDRKAIEGDTSDHIPGIKGVGEKAVIPLLQEFGTVEAIYEYVENTPEKEIKAFFKELGITRSPYSFLMKTSETELVGKASALLSKQLATIKRDIDELSSVQLADLILSVNEDGRRAIYSELAFQSLLA